MSQTRVLVLLAGAAMSIGAGTALAGTPDESSDQSRAYAAELKADAALRSSLLGQAEGDTNVKLGGFGQFRYTMNFRDDPPSTPAFHDSGFTNGFEAERTRLQATGNIGSKDMTFKVEGNFDSSGDFSLLDAYAMYNFGDGNSILAGQWQMPLWREWSLSPKGQLAADYSVMTEVFNPGYTQGIGYQHRGDSFGILASFNDGVRSGNTPYTSGSTVSGTGTGLNTTGEADWALTARAEFKGGGAWEQFDEFTSWRGNPTMWLIGGAAHWQSQGNTASNISVSQQDIFGFAIDAMLKGNGWNGYGAVVMSITDPPTGDSQNDFGGVLQGGVFVSDTVELFARYDGVFPDGDRAEDNIFQTICFGANAYPFAKSNAVKFTADVSWFLNETTENEMVEPVAESINPVGLLPSNQSDQFAVRLQFQWIF